MRRPSPIMTARVMLEEAQLRAEGELAQVVEGQGGRWSDELVKALQRRDGIMAALLLLPKTT